MASRKKAVGPLTKTEFNAKLADRTGLTKAQVAKVFEELEALAASEMKTRKVFAIPGFLKITSVHKPAKPARLGRNPRTGEQMMFKAQPAKDVVRLRALKKLKDLV